MASILLAMASNDVQANAWGRLPLCNHVDHYLDVGVFWNVCRLMVFGRIEEPQRLCGTRGGPQTLLPLLRRSDTDAQAAILLQVVSPTALWVGSGARSRAGFRVHSKLDSVYTFKIIQTQCLTQKSALWSRSSFFHVFSFMFFAFDILGFFWTRR